MTSKAGTKYRAENLDTDIKSLYESGLVDDVRFLAEPIGDSVKLIAEVTTRPGLGGVGFVGNAIFSDQKLAKESKMKAGGALSDDSRGTVWPYACAAGGLLLAAAGALVAARGRRWAALSQRYDAPAVREQAPPTPERAERELWESLDRGEDPTGRP